MGVIFVVWMQVESSKTCISAHHYHPSQCSRSLHRASRKHHPPPPSQASWWHVHPQQTQTHADTHLEKEGRVSDLCKELEFKCVKECFYSGYWRTSASNHRLWAYKSKYSMCICQSCMCSYQTCTAQSLHRQWRLPLLGRSWRSRTESAPRLTERCKTFYLQHTLN